MPRRLISWFARHGYLLAVLAIAVSTALFLPGRGTFANGQWALLYLLLVVLVAGVARVVLSVRVTSTATEATSATAAMIATTPTTHGQRGGC